MNAAAWIMLLVGAVLLWGGFAASVWHYLRSARRARGQNARVE